MKRLAAISLCALILLVGTVAAAPRPAQAQLVVVDPTNLVQNTVTAVQSVVTGLSSSKTLLNPLFYALAQTAIQSLVNSTVNWINSGFNGSPAYATNLQGTLQDAADQAADGFVRQFKSNLHINSPFRDSVSQTVLSNYYLSTSKDGFFLQNPYTLNQVSKNDKAFLNGDFSQGGFPAYLSAWMSSQNNPFSALSNAQDELARRVTGVQGQIHEELGWGNGFLSWRKCDLSGNQVTDNTQQDTIPVIDTATGKQVGTTAGPTTVTSLTQKQTCLASHIETPGSVISSQLNKSLGLGADSLVNAKEFDEIVNALLAQLMKNVLGSTGLSGLSQGSTASGARPYFNQTVTDTTSAGVSVASTFIQVMTSELGQLQTYQANWQKISDAANAAKTALQACNASNVAQADAVITQAATAIGKASTLSASLTTLQTQVIQAASAGDTASQNQVFAQANTSYACLLKGGTLASDNLTCNQPISSVTAGISTSDFTNAQAQADTNADSSLISQMNQLAHQTCAP